MPPDVFLGNLPHTSILRITIHANHRHNLGLTRNNYRCRLSQNKEESVRGKVQLSLQKGLEEEITAEER